MQFIVPLIFVAYFLFRMEYYSIFVVLWWLGEGMIGISRYISDAREQAMSLIGGNHDWAYLLSKMNLLEYDNIIGELVFYLGLVIMAVSIVIGIIISIKK